MAVRIMTVAEADGADTDTFLLTRRELAVLAVAIAMVVGAILLLVVACQQVAGALVGPV